MLGPAFARNQGVWNAYVAAGRDESERRVRLEECPAELRPGVESHLRMPAAIAAEKERQNQLKDWRDYVMRARTREGRRARLADVPRSMRAEVEAKVRRAFERRKPGRRAA